MCGRPYLVAPDQPMPYYRPSDLPHMTKNDDPERQMSMSTQGQMRAT